MSFLYSAFRDTRSAIQLLIFAWIATGVYANSYGYTSDDPVVTGMIEKGVRYLEASVDAKTHYALGSIHTGGYGELALLGYAHMKLAHDPENPVVKKGIQAALTFVRSLNQRDPGGHESKTVYAASVVALLLAEVDPIRYRSELERLVQFFRRYQFQNGAYGYLGDQNGDISQVQYAMLALWSLDRSGVVIDYPGIAKTIGWLLRVQDPGGGWPYNGVVSGSQGRIPQSAVTPSMAVAGGSAVLMAADILRLWGDDTLQVSSQIPGLPKAVKPYKVGMDNENVTRPTFPVHPIKASIDDCQTWLGRNSPDPNKLASQWPYYQLYSLERYESFREIAFKMEIDPNPEWYNAGVTYLRANQEPSGGWPQQNYTTGPVTTAFALLFLSRSTQKAIEQSSSGALAGGWELPKDTTEISVKGTQIKGREVATAVTDLLDVLEGDTADGLENKSIPDDIQLSTDPKERSAQLDRMERLVRGSQSWQARRVAARLLGQSDELRVVPSLIYALSDPDPVVPRYARDGLRFISRRFDGFGMPDKPNQGEVMQAQRQWRDWYRRMNPGYVFLDYDL